MHLRLELNFVRQKALYQYLIPVFREQNNLCELTTRTHKLKRLCVVETHYLNAGFIKYTLIQIKQRFVFTKPNLSLKHI